MYDSDIVAVLIAIQPRWVDRILCGEKVVEVRKTRPKLKTPFKVFIYMTAGDSSYRRDPWATAVMPPSGAPTYNGSQMVVGEFTCKAIENIFVGDTLAEHEDIQKRACLSELELQSYLNGSVGYGWQISDLVVYDTPKALSEFKKPCTADCNAICEQGCPTLTRPPQSWCYVQKLNAA